MTPAARIEAAITILDRILGGDPAEQALLRWSRASRFAGSGDRAAVRDLVFDSLRRLRSRAALGGAMTGRGLMLGMCRDEGRDPQTVFTGEGHAPWPLSADELARGGAPEAAAALDLPDWILPAWSEALGEAVEPVAMAMRKRAPVWLRANQLRATPDQAVAVLASEDIAAAPYPDLPTALCVSAGARRLAASSAYRDGLVEMQDLSPQLACSLLPDRGSLLDYCAGGGGKALALAARGLSPVTAHDADVSRMSDLPARAARAGVRVQITPPDKLSGRFDLVVADVPCSGSGTWRRTPDAKWRLTATQLAALVETQARILDEAAARVAAGGGLAYMTCSLLRVENQAQTAAFLHRAPEFELVTERLFTPLDASDGFYLCLMQRH
ncbi:RsmB/NOP family class I SAM-dependent RNA methyltransferase [Paracoccus lutimaris]|uniref:16S rRNA (Cytosine967-C5)-methyltransferase n=1 Tax=Paracoccus lutimaris TaxID=1490030 RepID=A0A368Z2V6_9RHOB|nr:RsmB/NOP family class I SAM-dependent RNA methyltransferase [Paracoccus lutimaris]RCW86785.1 16S rRNA (cytosine967-C5)-methyltransferase [Paracoccus lutimaris]